MQVQKNENGGRVKMSTFQRLKKNSEELSPDRFIRKYVKL